MSLSEKAHAAQNRCVDCAVLCHVGPRDRLAHLVDPRGLKEILLSASRAEEQSDVEVDEIVALQQRVEDLEDGFQRGGIAGDLKERRVSPRLARLLGFSGGRQYVAWQFAVCGKGGPSR